MRTSLTKSKSSFILFLTITAFPLWAKPVAQVTNISGQVFMVTPDGNTKILNNKDHVEEKSEVLVEEGATVTLNDYYDATYHLVGGSHLTFYNKSVQLKRGKTWIQSYNSRQALALTTANGHVDFSKGEFIATFDQATSRSQVLVVNGDVEVSNVLDRNTKYIIPAGNFTLVDPEVENGIPRAPTKVGLSSLNSALADFKKLPTSMKEATLPSRAIASVAEEAKDEKNEKVVKKGEIIFISTNRLPASVHGKAHQYYKKTAGMKGSELTHAPIKFYGTSWAPRKPASILPVKPVAKKAAIEFNLDPEFTESLKKESSEQPKHSKELEGLIEDLKSY